jgi:hypothetical protein
MIARIARVGTAERILKPWETFPHTAEPGSRHQDAGSDSQKGRRDTREKDDDHILSEQIDPVLIGIQKLLDQIRSIPKRHRTDTPAPAGYTEIASCFFYEFYDVFMNPS